MMAHHARSDSAVDRAAKFEDEKRRIIESCFSKRQEDGSFYESYITHVRVTEDAAFPISPPPPDSPPENKKPRVVIVSVRQTGRVRMHKARENANSTFSIGKTWLLDDLTQITSFTSDGPLTGEQRVKQSWAGETGFQVNLGKPYFWSAVNAQEKRFFVGSLVKIYRKYTSTDGPELSGFSSQEMAAYQPRENVGARAGSYGPQTPPNVPSATMRPPPQFESPGIKSTASNEFIPGHRNQGSQGRNGQLQDQGRNLRVQDSASQLGSARSESPARSFASRGTTGAPNPLDLRNPPMREGSEYSPSINGPPSRYQSPRTGFTPDKQAVYSPMPQTDSPMSTPPIPGPRSQSRIRSNGSMETGAPPAAPPDRRRPPMQSSPMSNGFRPPDTTRDIPGRGLDFDRSRPSAEPARKSNDEPRPRTAESQKSTPSIQVPEIPAESPSEEAMEETFRPGLGPMMKKRSARDLFKKAALAHSAFKPRAGGAGDRLKMELNKSPTNLDGINGVFTPPTLPKSSPGVTPSAASVEAADPMITAPLFTKPANATNGLAPVAQTQPLEVITTVNGQPPPLTIVPTTTTFPLEIKPARSKAHTKYAKALGIDANLLEGRIDEIENALDGLDWAKTSSNAPSLEDIQQELRRDLAKLESGSWLSHVEDNVERLASVGTLLDKTIAECDELDGLLTLYSVELGSLRDDVAYIQAQEQGLQVQAANQQELYRDLQQLLETLSVSSTQLNLLKSASLNSSSSLGQVEGALVDLYKAMVVIDPALKENPLDSDAHLQEVNGLSNMRAVSEKRQGYRNSAVDFTGRFRKFMDVKFAEADSKSGTEIKTSLRSAQTPILSDRTSSRPVIWLYLPLMLFTKKVASDDWESMISQYSKVATARYQSEFNEYVTNCKRNAKLGNSDEDTLFTYIEKDTESLVKRGLTVKKSKATRELPKTLAEKASIGNRREAYQIFAQALFDMSQVVITEQNFLVEFFHLNQQNTLDFPDFVFSTTPENRRVPDLVATKPQQADRPAAKRVQSYMQMLFMFWHGTLQSLIDWSLSHGALQGIGLLFALESRVTQLYGSDQDYVSDEAASLSTNLMLRLNRVIDEQIRAIEETKVKISKRKGVISFMKVFPVFAYMIEDMLPSPIADASEIRGKVNDIYDRICKAMWDSLDVIGRKDSEAVGETEEKQILNHHILWIENMNHYLEEVRANNNRVLGKWVQQARSDMQKHMTSYIDTVARRPLGRFLTTLESTEAAMSTAPGGPASIATTYSHAPATFRKHLNGYDAKEFKRGAETLKKRVEKHFGDADDPTLSRALVAKVLAECDRKYSDSWDRLNRLIREVYGGEMELEFNRDDMVGVVKRA